LNNFFGKYEGHSSDEEGQWIAVSDLMAGLMMVFLFIAIAMMRHAYTERDKIKSVAVTYQENQVALYQSLVKEFENDFILWDAELDRNTLSFNFKSPDVLFNNGEINLKPEFKMILDDFFPRYFDVIKVFDGSISEIRIEGHTSSVWNRYSSKDDAYFKNMELSQGRTRSVLQYVYFLQNVENDRKWISQHVAAVGLSSSKVILDVNGREDKRRSRRVSFRIITNSETQIRKIIEESL